VTNNQYLTLDQLGETIHEKVNDRFQDRAMPTESVSENFIHQIVRSILKELQNDGKIPFIPDFKILNKTSMEERFADNIPDFSKHINLVGLDKERPYDEFGVMNIAFDGDDTERYQDAVDKEEEAAAEEDTEESSPPAGNDSDQANDSSDSDVDIPDYLTVIEGGKSNG